MKSVFTPETNVECIDRINQISTESQPVWGKMNAGQMFAHLNVAYAIAFDKIEVKNNFFMKFILKKLIKPIVTGEKPYKKNGQTSPVFLIADERDLEKERQALIENIKKVEELGQNHFEGKVNQSFGKLTSQEWNNMFYKHLNHHLTQFGV